jgi:dienelactone hydrolase
VLTPTSLQTRPVVGCLLMSAGLIHRVGPHRINVQAARELARRGIPSLRMDLSGVGDSLPARSTEPARVQAVADLQAGLALLESVSGVQRFLVAGICSGAEQTYDLALADPRVRGILMFDGFTFSTVLTGPIGKVRRLLRLRVSAVPARMRQAFSGPKITEASSDWNGGAPARAEFRDAMDRLVDRGVSVYIIYSGSVLERHSYKAQLRHAFRGARFVNRIRYEYLPRLDHTLVTKAAQREFVDRTAAWATECAHAVAGSADE